MVGWWRRVLWMGNDGCFNALASSSFVTQLLAYAHKGKLALGKRPCYSYQRILVVEKLPLQFLLFFTKRSHQ